MRYIDVCSGISAPTMAWKPLGWEALCFAEIEAAPRAVLAHHYPDVPLRGDFTEIRGDEYGPVDLLVGGTPCQSFSVAGLRGGLADERGNLALEYLRLADRARPRWLVWENVPGVLSSSGGRDFGTFLGGLAQLGYGFAYAVLDAQHFGVPQRRRRVFVVGYLGDWRRAAAVLFERHSLQGHPPPRREAGKNVARSIRAQSQSSHREDSDNFVAVPSTGDTSHCLNAGGMGRQDYETETLIAHTLRGEGFDASEDGTGRGTPIVPVAFNITPSNSNKDFNAREARYAQAITAGGNRPSARGGDLVADTLTSNGDAHSGYRDEKGLVAVAFQEAQTGCREYDTAGTLRADGPGHDPVGTRIREGSAVRRLTPRECERLQGFPDDFTLVPYRGGMMKDGPRYKMLGNSMAVPVVRWIGERIARVDALAAEREAA